VDAYDESAVYVDCLCQKRIPQWRAAGLVDPVARQIACDAIAGVALASQTATEWPPGTRAASWRCLAAAGSPQKAVPDADQRWRVNLTMDETVLPYKDAVQRVAARLHFFWISGT
jgi:hypothetical protein